MEYPVTNYSHPINRFDFSKLTKEETKDYFTWFMSVRFQRIDNLQNFINATSDKKIELDYTTDSLIPLWEWYEPWISFRDETEEEIREKMRRTPERFRETVLQNNKILTEQTFAMIDDIAVYMAETMIKNHPKLYWDYFMKPIRLVHVKMPVVRGFDIKHGMDPIRIVHVMALRSARQRDAHRLLDIYRIREEDIVE